MRCYLQGLRSHFLLTTLLLVLLFGVTKTYGQGEELFNAKCKACHHPINNSIGPALQGVKEKWEAEEPGLIYTWVRKWTEAAGQSDFAAEVAASRPDNMNLFPALTDAEIDDILAYADSYTEDAVAGGTETASAQGQEEESLSYWWYIMGGVLLVVIFTAAGFRRQVGQIHRASRGEDVGEKETYFDIIKDWAGRNTAMVSILGLVVLFTVLVIAYDALLGIGVYSNYNPPQPVEAFSHKIHVTDNEIDCKMCHSSATRSRHAGLPTMNACMNCHKGIEGASDEGKKSVAYLREMAGFNSEALQYTEEAKPIAWNRVYVLPDHAYFNHSQHVVVGGLECKNCHGDMGKQTTARIVETDELEPVGGLEENKLTRPVLTMGWCIECHGNVAVNPSADMDKGDKKVTYYEEIHRRLTKRPDVYKKYLDDEKVTVSELGGWECAKCHY